MPISSYGLLSCAGDGGKNQSKCDISSGEEATTNAGDCLTRRSVRRAHEKLHTLNSCAHSTGDNREKNVHGCAVFELAFYPQKSAVRLDKVFHDRQAEPCAAQFTRARFINAVEALCQMRKVFLWDSTAGVGNSDF